MDWDLSTIEHHDACPFQGACTLLGPVKPLDTCIWCFVLAQADHQRRLLKDIFEHASDLESAWKNQRKLMGTNRRQQPATRWDAYGE